jgi:glycosyltransferase involved in cell wall biosynthesis
MKGKNILVSGLQDFDIAIGSNCVNLAKEFAKENRVLYVNFPLDRMSKMKYPNHPLIKKRIDVQNGERDALIKVNDNLWSYTPDCTIESIAKLPFNSLFDFLNRRNNKIFASSIKKILTQLDFKDFVFFQDSDIYRSFHLKELLKPDLYIYYTRDNLIFTDYYKRHGERIEAKHMAKADLVVANSSYLADYGRQHNKNSFYVGQGCDFSLFDSNREFERPELFDTLQGPVIGYIGALKSLRLDIQILEHIAKEKKDWNVVLVGPEDEDFQKSELHNMDNVHFTGSKPVEELPVWLKYFDVALNPQKVNEVTIGNYPRKIDEYLAMGTPTVATKTKAMSVFKDYVGLAETKEDYISLISEALETDSESLREDRITFAKSHTWENNVLEIYKAIETANKK